MKKISALLLSLCLLCGLAASFGRETLAAGETPEVRIGLESAFLNKDSITFNDRELSVGYEQGGVFWETGTFAAVSGFSVGCSGSEIVLYDGQSVAAVFDGNPQFFNASGSVTSIGGKKYRGRVELSQRGGKITAINVLSVEEYLYGSVPSEMPSSWNQEALRAQAVAARTYIYARTGVHSASGYDLCDTNHCQVYLGYGNESVAASAAVDATAGIVATYNGQPITASFFASSGGYTEDSEKVWVTAEPYLRAVPDTYETEGKIWSREYTLQDIERAVAARNADIGAVTGVSISEASASGRVQELVITGAKGSLSLTKEEIRAFFAPLQGGMLESRNFTIANGYVTTTPAQAYVYDGKNTANSGLAGLSVVSGSGAVSALPNQTLSVISASGVTSVSPSASVTSSNSNAITLSGRGNGHGVGMSQYGAKGMAEAGFGFDEILRYYYTGIELGVR